MFGFDNDFVVRFVRDAMYAEEDGLSVVADDIEAGDGRRRQGAAEEPIGMFVLIGLGRRGSRGNVFVLFFQSYQRQFRGWSQYW